MASKALQEKILLFWFGTVRSGNYAPASIQQSMSLWWGVGNTPEQSKALDATIREQFGSHLEDAAHGKLDTWHDDATGVLAYCVLCDQMSRHIHRGSARAFEMDKTVVQVVKRALDNHMDAEIALVERPYMYLPLMHSEELEDHALALTKYTELVNQAGLDESMPHLVGYAKGGLGALASHTATLQRFGRYPHRNRLFNRENTPEETAYMNSPDFNSWGQ